MGSVGSPVVRRIVQVSRCAESPEELLASVGLSLDADPRTWAGETVEEEAYYALVERAAGPDDPGLPFRYGEALRLEDLGALGLALKTAPTLSDALARLARYILVLSDTLEYELVDEPGGRAFALLGRPHHRRGAAVANECALAAVTSAVRQAAGGSVDPLEVSFRHGAPADDAPHRDYFGCPVRFSAARDALCFGNEVLERRPALADEGLSSYLLAELEQLHSSASERSLVLDVRSAVTDALPDGQPSKSQIARRLGMSERTLHRRLAEHGESFQELATRVRREAAESLLSNPQHSLAEVAFLTGFSDQSAFTRAFGRWTGVTPAAYRSGGR